MKIYLLTIDEGCGSNLVYPCSSFDVIKTVLGLYVAKVWDNNFPGEQIPNTDVAIDRLFDDNHDYYYWIDELEEVVPGTESEAISMSEYQTCCASATNLTDLVSAV